MALVFLKTTNGVQPLWVENGQIIDPQNLPDAVRAQMGDPLMMKLCRLTVPALLNFLDVCGCETIGLKKTGKQSILDFIADNWEDILRNVHLMAHPAVLRRVAEEVATYYAPSMRVFEGEGYQLDEPNEADARDEPRGSNDLPVQPVVEDRTNKLIHISVKVIDGNETKVRNLTFLPSNLVGAISFSVRHPNIGSKFWGVFLNGYILSNDMEIGSLRLGAEDDLVCRELSEEEDNFIEKMQERITELSLDQQFFELNTEGYGCKKVIVLAPTHRAIPIHIAYHFKNETVGDLKQSLGAFLKIDTDDFNEKYALRTERSVLEDWETLFPLLSDFQLKNSLPLCVHLVPSLRGAGKRARVDGKPVEKVNSIKELKQVVQQGMVQLQSMTNQAPVVVSIIEQIDGIMNKVKSEPNTTVSSLMARVPNDKLSIIVASTMTHSPRPHERVRFIAEHTLSDLFEDLEALSLQKSLAQSTLCSAIQFAIHSEFTDANGGIAWTRLLKVVADTLGKQTEASEAEDRNTCILM